MSIILFSPLATINRLTRIEGGDELTQIEGGDDLHACVSARVPYLGPLALVVVGLIPNANVLTKNSIKHPPPAHRRHEDGSQRGSDCAHLSPS